jgi:hypothetical protein
MNYSSLHLLGQCVFGGGIMIWAYRDGRIGARGLPEAEPWQLPDELRAAAFICGAIMVVRAIWFLLFHTYLH